MKIRRISAQAFRGFPGVVDFNLSETVTIVFAPNGSGKTSLSEAFEWTLYGEVARKTRSKTPGEFGHEFLRSVHASPGDETWAEVELIKPDNTSLTLRRTLKGKDTVLTANGTLISSVSEVSIETGLSFHPCLGQSEIKAFIDTEPKERWKQISSILGLGGFDAVRERLMKLRNDTDKYPEVFKVREAARRAVAPLTPPNSDPLNQDPDNLLRKVNEELKLPEGSDWASIGDTAEKKITTLLSSDKKPASLDLLISGPEKLEYADCETEVTKINDGIEKHREWHSSNAKKQFIEIGVTLSTVPHCPFCEEETLTDKKLQEHQDFLTNAEETPPQLNAQFSQTISDFKSIQTSPINIAVIPSLIDALAGEEDILKALEGLPRRQQNLATDLVTFGALARSYLAATEPKDTTPVIEVQQLGKQVILLAQQLVHDYTNLRSDAVQAKELILAKFKGLTPEERLQLERLQSIKALANNIHFVKQAWEISKRQADLGKLISDFQQSEKDAVQSFEKDLADDVRDYLTQLSSSKVLEFKRFNIKSGAYRQAGLEATAYNKPVNPTSMFSEAQGNCLGLSLYFSQRVNRNPGWQSIILDDPVQSMDDDHKGNLVSLLSKLQASHQLLIFTHDREYATFLSNQFRYDPQYVEYEIVKTDLTPVPEIKTVAERFEHLMTHAGYLADGSSIQREDGFNAVRRGVESLVKGLAHSSGVALKGDLETRITSLLNKPLNPTDAGTLQRIRKLTNANSHDSTSTTAAGLIKSAISDLQSLKATYL